MKKIPTIFVRDLSRNPPVLTREWRPECTWVRDGEGVATRKYDGTCCLIRDGLLFKRRETHASDKAPPGFEAVDIDIHTEKVVGWVPVSDTDPTDKWHREAATFGPQLDGTYELLGPKVNGNKDKWAMHAFMSHANATQYPVTPRDYEGLQSFLQVHDIEGIVFHHPDGRMAKIKRKDFGLKW